MATYATASQKSGSPLLFRLGGAGEEESSPTMNTAALIREVTQDFGDMMEEKLSKFKETLEKKINYAGKPIKTHYRGRVSDVEDTGEARWSREDN